MKFMKKTIYSTLLLAAGLGTATSCSDFLDQSSPSELTTEAVFNNTYYTSQVLNKVYGALTEDNTYSNFMSIVAGLSTDCELVDGLGADAANTSSERGNMNYNCNPGWSKLAQVWDAMYEAIEYANQVVGGVNNSPLLETGDASEKKEMLRYRAEAKTLRAMLYLDLIRLWGDVPFKTDVSEGDLSNAYIGKTDRDEIMDSLIVDLQESIEYLPWAGEESYTTEHITKGYAHGLLANIALTRAGFSIRERAKEGYITAANHSDPVYPTQRCGDEKRAELYKLAEQHLASVINSGRHALTASVSEYWRMMNIAQLQTAQPENLFEIPMVLNKSGELGYTVGFRINGQTPFFGLKGNSTGKLKMTAPYFWSFDQSGKDARRDITCANSQIRNRDGVIKEEILGNSPFGIYCGKWDYRIMSENSTWLAAVRAGDASAKICSGVNVVKMRYPYVLLMYAEVVNENYGPDGHGVDAEGQTCSLSAKDALVEVHRRAYNDKAEGERFINNVIAEKGFFEAVVQENAWELAGEGVRKFDLIRWNLLSEKIDRFKADYTEGVSKTVEEGGYPEKVYYKAKANPVFATEEIDMSTVDWYSGESQSGYTSANFWGRERTDTKGQEQLNVNLPSIASGLNRDVLNRYLLPIASTTISTSNGQLHNSYGYTD